jgi:hypothetical protein
VLSLRRQIIKRTRCGIRRNGCGQQTCGKVCLRFSLPVFLLLSFSLFFSVVSPAQEEPQVTGPKLLSIFPLGAARGTTVEAEIRGNLLEGAYAVWFDTGNLNARVLSVEEAKEQFEGKTTAPADKLKKAPIVYRVRIKVEVPRTARVGPNSLRLVSPQGISDPVPFPVLDEPAVGESAASHQTVGLAQPVGLPAIINGRLEKHGEVDFYSFHAKQGQKISFAVVLSQNCNPRLGLYRAGGSWLNADRPIRLLTDQDRSSDLIPVEALGTYRVSQDGQYFLEVSSVFGKGTPDSTYQVRISSQESAPQYESQYRSLPETIAGDWSERSFSRKLEDSWMASLLDRTVKTVGPSPEAAKGEVSSQGIVGGSSPESPKQTPSPETHAALVLEGESSKSSGQVQEISIPALIEGRVERPGDVDSYRFRVEAGQKLAFEIETPDAKPPYFNPRLGVTDSQDHELFSSVERRLSMFNANADPQVFLIQAGPKSTYTFERGGEYVLQVRDVTSRYGDPSFRYRVLVRPQVSHVGDLKVMEGEKIADHINLTLNEPSKLTVVAEYEEGFAGDLLFSFTGLPEGVQAFPGTEFHKGEPPLEVTQNPQITAPRKQSATIVMLATPDAKLSSNPAVVKLYCRLVENGRLGPNLLVETMPLMVVKPVPQKEETKPSGKPLGARTR